MSITLFSTIEWFYKIVPIRATDGYFFDKAGGRAVIISIITFGKPGILALYGRLGLDSRRRLTDDGRRTTDDGRWTMDDERRTMDDERWTTDDGDES